MQKNEKDSFAVEANIGVVVRGEIDRLKSFLRDIERLINSESNLRLIYKNVSADRLWIVGHDNRKKPPELETNE